MAIPTPMSKVIPVNLDFKNSSISNWKPFNTGMAFWTNDIGTAFLEFSTELDLTGTVASIVLENQYDKSLVQKTITEITSSPFYYQLGDEIQHEGRWFVQISITKDTKTIVSNSFAFMVNASVGHGKVARLVSIETFETLATQLTALQSSINNYLTTAQESEAIRVSTYEELLTDGVLTTNIENKLNNLESTYAPDLFSVKQQLADKVSLTGSGQVGWANIAQDARLQIIGTTPPAVVGDNSVITSNLTDRAVATSKLSDNAIDAILKIKQIEDNRNYLPLTYALGSVDAGTGAVGADPWWAVSSLFTADVPLSVKLSGGYKVSYYTYNLDGSYVNYSAWVATDFTLAADKKYRFAVLNSADGITTADVDNVYYNILVADGAHFRQVGSEDITNGAVSPEKLYDEFYFKQYPFTKDAGLFKSELGGGLGAISSLVIRDLFFKAKTNERYYVNDLYPTGNNKRKISIRNVSGSDAVWFEAAQADGNPYVLSGETELVSLTDGIEIVGYAEVDWSKANDYGTNFLLVDTEVLPMTHYLSPPTSVTFYNADDYPAVVGRELNLYYDNFVQTKNMDEIYFRLFTTIVGIQQFDDGIRITPTVGDIGVKSITVDVYDARDSRFIDHVTFTITTVADAVLATQKKALFIGDSLTDDKAMVPEIKDMLGANFTLYGTRGTAPYNHEGRSGWSAAGYNTTADNNPFYNPVSQQFDFAYYMTNHPEFADVDIVNIFLGRNDGYGAWTAPAVAVLVNSVKAYDATIDVVLMSPYNTALSNKGETITTPTYRYRTDIWLAINGFNTVFGNRENEGIYIVPTHINLDTAHDYPHVEVAVSARNPELVTRTTDVIHPSDYGYKKLADVWYNWFVSKYLTV